jgi:hypothetical protein
MARAVVATLQGMPTLEAARDWTGTFIDSLLYGPREEKLRAREERLRADLVEREEDIVHARSEAFASIFRPYRDADRLRVLAEAGAVRRAQEVRGRLASLAEERAENERERASVRRSLDRIVEEHAGEPHWGGVA